MEVHCHSFTNCSQPWFCHPLCSWHTLHIYLLYLWISLPSGGNGSEMPLCLVFYSVFTENPKGEKRLNSSVIIWYSLTSHKASAVPGELLVIKAPGLYPAPCRHSAPLLLTALEQWECSVTKVSHCGHSGTSIHHTACRSSSFLARSSTTQETAHSMSPTNSCPAVPELSLPFSPICFSPLKDCTWCSFL